LLRQRYRKLHAHCAITLMLELHQTIVQPTACYASEVWGLRHMPRPFKDIRASLGSHFVSVLRNLCGVRRSVPAAVMLHELNFLPLQTQWQYSAVRLWNNLTSLPQDSIYRTIAADDLQSARQNTKLKNWAAGLLECAKACHFSLTLPSGEMQLVSMQHVTAAAMAAATADRQSHDTYDPRTAPSKGAKQYTYQAWFSRPSWAVGPEFWQLQLSVPQLHAVLRLRLGSHNLPIEAGRLHRPPLPRQQRTCEFCDSGAVGDEQHLLMECAATDGARAAFPALFTQQPQPSMQQFLWQRDRMAVAKFVLMCLSSVGIVRTRTDNT